MAGGSKGSKISALIDLCDVSPLTPEQRQSASRLVCRWSEDATDATTLMSMLGLMPSQKDEYLDVVVGSSTGIRRTESSSLDPCDDSEIAV